MRQGGGWLRGMRPTGRREFVSPGSASHGVRVSLCLLVRLLCLSGRLACFPAELSVLFPRFKKHRCGGEQNTCASLSLVYALPIIWCAYQAWDVLKALSKSAEQLQFQVHVVASGLLLGGVCGAFFGKQMKHLFRVSGR